MKLTSSVTATACALGAAACAAPPSAGSRDVNEAAFMLTAQSYRDSGDLVEITSEAYPSAIASATIRVWISAFAAAAYRTIDPDQSGAHTRLPEGSLIIREVYDDAGALKKLTLMGKDARGYNPEVGDYWFGVTDPDGTPQLENGKVLTGRLDQCYSCHQTRGETEDFLFGVPVSARGGDPDPGDPTPPPPPPPIDPGPVCGDFACEPPESCAQCPSDCCYDDDDHGGGDDDHGGGGDHGGRDDDHGGRGDD